MTHSATPAATVNLPEGVLIYCLDGNRDALTGESETINPVAGDPGVGNPQTGHGGLAVRSVRVRHIGKVLHSYVLDLSGSTLDVARNLDQLASWMSGQPMELTPGSHWLLTYQ